MSRLRDKLAKHREQNHRCAICGEEFEFDAMHGDHIVPRSQGGHTMPDNCQLLCTDRNPKKGTDQRVYAGTLLQFSPGSPGQRQGA